MYPERKTAEAELKLAGQMNPGPWEEHSRHVAEAAQYIAGACGELEQEKAYVCGLLHDIGRRNGISAMRHAVDGYDYLMSKGWDEPARICLTHSFPIRDVDTDIGRKDITPEQYAFLRDYLAGTEYDDYDRLIILCDSLAMAEGFCILEKRLVDTTRRYGAFPFTVERWNHIFEIKAYFEKKIGRSIYELLPGIEQCIYQ